MTIDKTFIEELMIKQSGKCAYSGIPLKTEFGIRHPDAVSVDRIDSTGSYTTDNVQLVCDWINGAKGAMTHQEFVNRISFIRTGSWEI